MPLMRCSFCGTRANISLNEVDRRSLQGQGYILHTCNTCGGQTHWEPTLDKPTLAGAGPKAVGPRVLLIDDDDAILQIIGKALSLAHCDVETANSARSAAMMLARGDFDVILSDIRMPEFNGIQLFEFLDQHLPECKQRVIFLTGDTGTQSTAEFLEKSKAPYMTKPVDLPKLLQMVHSLSPGK